MNKQYRLFIWAMTIFTILVISLAFYYRHFLKIEINSIISAYGLLGIVLMVFILDFFPQYLSSYLVLISGLVFGLNPIITCMFVIIASSSSAILAYKLGKKSSKRFIKNIIEQRDYEKMSEGINKWGKWIVFASAITPIPYFPILFGALGFDQRKFYFYGLLPRALGFIAVTILFVFLPKYISL